MKPETRERLVLAEAWLIVCDELLVIAREGSHRTSVAAFLESAGEVN